jgi:hypothetical protein
VKKLYRRVFIEDEPVYHNESDDVDWLINNMFIYSNDQVATMYGYVSKMTSIFRRNYMLSLEKYTKNETVANYITHSFENLDVKKQIKIMWGLFLVEERNECIYEWFKMYEINPITF